MTDTNLFFISDTFVEEDHMTDSKRFAYKNPKPRCGGNLKTRWNYTEPAYRMAPHVWNVGGQDDVSAYLLDSGEGLILIDTGYEDTLYLLIDHIWRIGYDPADIKKILLSHYHGDHSQGARLIQEMAGGKENCEIWLSEADEINHQRTKDETVPMEVLPYEVTNFYDPQEPVMLGRFVIRTRLTPGHTWGATSFFFDDTDEETGKTYHCAMHGGLGTAMMKPGTQRMEHELMTPEGAFRFIRDCLELAEMDVDINLPSHLNQANLDENLPEDLNDYTWFVNDYSWHDMLVNRAEEVMSYYPEIYPDLVRTIPTLK